MNTTTAPFSNNRPTLKITRRVPQTEAVESPELAADLEALQEREANLRAYEARLRVWQERLDVAAAQQGGAATAAPFSPPATTQSPFPGDPSLTEASERFHRARALLEAEQNQLRDERMALRAAEATLRQREAEVSAREASVADREARLAAAAGAAAVKQPASAIQRLTQAPWSVFKSAK